MKALASSLLIGVLCAIPIVAQQGNSARQKLIENLDALAICRGPAGART